MPSAKIDKCELLTGEKILTSDQSRIIEQDKFTYSPLSKPCKKQKNNEPQTDSAFMALNKLWWGQKLPPP